MAEESSIAWTRSTFNPWIGCTKVGPGCDHCYAEQLDKTRFSKTLPGSSVIHWGTGAPRYRTKRWGDPLRWEKRAAAGDKPWRVFCASLADVFDNEVPQEWRDDLWKVVEATPNLSWLIVTKRIGNITEKMIPRLTWWADGFPKHVRVLITVCNQEEANRDIPKLLALPCNNGISYEPALGPVNWRPWFERPQHGLWRVNYPNGRSKIEWIIVGGESTQGAGKARPFDLAWARSTIAQCKAAGVPVFVKQLGSAAEWNDPDPDNSEPPYWMPIKLRDRASADIAEWPKDLRVQEFPI